ncbi:hypothetical protein RUND412_004734 [Rhizina undulata]
MSPPTSVSTKYPLGTPSLPHNVLYRIFSYLPTTSLFIASLVSHEWRQLIYHSGVPSLVLLRPHLAILRQRFGSARVPFKLPVATVRKLIAEYCRIDLYGQFVTTTTYDIERITSSTWEDYSQIPLRLRRFALCSELLAVAGKRGAVYIYELTKSPIELLTVIKLKHNPTALAISEGYLAVVDAECVYLYSLLARNTPSFMATAIYSLNIPQIKYPTAVAVTPGFEDAPLVAVLTNSLWLIHPSFPLSQKRRRFFRSNSELEPPVRRSRSNRSSYGKGKGKERQHDFLETPTSPSSRWPHNCLLESPASEIGASFPMSFSMYGRQLLVAAHGHQTHSGYLGSLYSNEDPKQLERRHSLSLKDGENIGTLYDPDQLWRHYKAKISPYPSQGEYTKRHRWHAQFFETSGMCVEAVQHLWDAFYLLTEVDTRWVRIVSIAPWERLMVLYRREDEAGSRLDERESVHCGYVVTPGGPETGYIAFSHRRGRLKILPLHMIDFKSWEFADTPNHALTKDLKDIAIGRQDILGMAGDEKRVVIYQEGRIVSIALWATARNEVPAARAFSLDGAEWKVDRWGKVLREEKRKRSVVSRRRSPCVIQ